MDFVATQAKLVEGAAGGEDRWLTATVPREEVAEALQIKDGEPALLLDVIRSNGDGVETLQRKSVAVAWDHADLERLLQRTSGERVTIAIDRSSLLEAFDADVEAHGIRHAAAVLTVALATAGTAGAAVPSSGGGGPVSAPGGYDLIEDLRGSSGAQASDAYQAVEAARAGRTAPEAAPDPYAGIENVRATPDVATDPYAGIEGVRAAPPEAGDPYAGIEGVRAAPPEAGDPYAGIEGVRVAPEPAPDAYTVVENVRADRTAPEATPTGGEGFDITAPSPAEAAALAASAAALAIAGAAFAVRRRRPGLA
jgi:hypothetical protein